MRDGRAEGGAPRWPELCLHATWLEFRVWGRVRRAPSGALLCGARESCQAALERVKEEKSLNQLDVFFFFF